METVNPRLPVILLVLHVARKSLSPNAMDLKTNVGHVAVVRSTGNRFGLRSEYDPNPSFKARDSGKTYVQRRLHEHFAQIRRQSESEESNSVASSEFALVDLNCEMLRIRFPSISIRVCLSDYLCLADGALLNDTIIDFYLNHIVAHLIPDDSPLRIHVFPSLFWYQLTSCDRSFIFEEDFMPDDLSSMAARFACLNHWTDGFDIFENDFLIVPINEAKHWSLLIVCAPALAFSRESLQSCIIILDSQSNVESASLRCPSAVISEFLMFEWLRKRAGRKLRTLQPKHFCSVVPQNLPQQTNNVDCGLYILEYANKILLDPPPLESLNRGEFDFAKRYPDFSVTDKRRDLRRILLALCYEKEPWFNLLSSDHLSLEEIPQDVVKNGPVNGLLSSPI
ncbi:hypothetical protein AB6A40_008878 [Gnathostoma spinigerum]|uniref:Ubiquitin-like protease family profile domain-containing protein n=1 Tax=Gnathostoma spinigerum TaxID=75299 RepID=A0ABD6EQB7_9BILA